MSGPDGAKSVLDKAGILASPWDMVMIAPMGLLSLLGVGGVVALMLGLKLPALALLKTLFFGFVFFSVPVLQRGVEVKEAHQHELHLLEQRAVEDAEAAEEADE